MNTVYRVAMLAVCAFFLSACSEKTKTETKEALQATGEAAKSAAEDTKENLKKAAEVGKAAVEKTKEEFSSPPENPPDSPASETPSHPPGDSSDANTTPESQE